MCIWIIHIYTIHIHIYPCCTSIFIRHTYITFWLYSALICWGMISHASLNYPKNLVACSKIFPFRLQNSTHLLICSYIICTYNDDEIVAISFFAVAFSTYSLREEFSHLMIPPTHFARKHCLLPLRWRHNDHAGVSNHQPHGCLLNRLFRRKSKKTSKLRVTGLCAGNSPGTGEFPAQMASYAENVSIWWRHHAIVN